MKIIAATKNKNKLREFGEILKGFEIISQEEAGLDIEVEETGSTFEENSMLKARAIYEASRLPAIADDSGLVVDALGGEPGVYSARYGGEGLDDKGRVELLLKNMKEVPKEERTARFVCAITLVDGARVITARGECEGVITYEPSGENGFGYDPVFFVQEYNKTLAEATPEEKNAISHRGKALRDFERKVGM
ncbi:MAG: XTP/dITP diphosphatase [Clostridia bacterium]|nr:XTP/dITP diphosphatase [Clostridia bacterium]